MQCRCTDNQNLSPDGHRSYTDRRVTLEVLDVPDAEQIVVQTTQYDPVFGNMEPGKTYLVTRDEPQ